MKKTAVVCLIASGLLSVSALASEQCPSRFTELGRNPQSYVAFFNELSTGGVYRPERQPEGLVGERIYAPLFGRWVPASDRTESLADRGWQSWSRSDWNLVLNELRQARPVVADSYGAQEVVQLNEKIKGVECYANAAASKV
jgi:hypothetical protein